MKISESKAKQYIEDIEILKGMSKREFLDRAQDVLFDSYDDNDESTINFWDAIEEYGSEDIFKLLDEDGDGVLGEDEINKFNELDGDDENLSLYDLENIMAEIEATEAATATNSSNVTTYGNSNPNTTSNPDAGVQARTPEQIESEIQTKEEQKAQVQTDTQSKVNEIETQMTTELQALGGEIAQQIAQFEADDAKLDSDIATTNQDLNTQQVALQTANANAAAQQDAISRYGSQIQSLQAAMSQEGADTAGLSAKIANLEAAKGQAESNLLAAQAEAEQAQIQIDILEAQKIQLEADKVALKEKLIQANQDNEEVKRIVEAAQNQITEIQNNEKTQISSIDSEIQALRTELAKAKQEEQVSKTLAENSDNSGFDAMLEEVLKYEGGYVNDPDDRGGATNMGVTQGTYNSWLKSQGKSSQSVKNITKEEVKQIYYNNYFVASGADKYLAQGNSAYAFALFDAAINHGVGGAKKLHEQANGDVNKFMEARKQKYLNIVANNSSQKKFAKGWQNRWNNVYSFIDSSHEYEAYAVKV